MRLVSAHNNFELAALEPTTVSYFQTNLEFLMHSGSLLHITKKNTQKTQQWKPPWMLTRLARKTNRFFDALNEFNILEKKLAQFWPENTQKLGSRVFIFVHNIFSVEINSEKAASGWCFIEKVEKAPRGITYADSLNLIWVKFEEISLHFEFSSQIHFHRKNYN